MSELVYDLNTALKDMLDWDTLNDGVTPEFIPITGYENNEAPFILYSTVPKIVSAEKYFQSKDLFRYYVYDNSFDRMYAISSALKSALNVASDSGLETLKSYMPATSEHRILYSVLKNAISYGPIEREGFLYRANEFEVCYVEL